MPTAASCCIAPAVAPSGWRSTSCAACWRISASPGRRRSGRSTKSNKNRAKEAVMKITELTAHVIAVPLKTTFWMSREPYKADSEIIVELKTDEGITGIGQIHGRPMAEIVDILNDFGELIRGMDAMGHIPVWP